MIRKDYIHSMDGIDITKQNYSETMSFIESCLMDIKLLGVEKSNLMLFDEYTVESEQYISEGVSSAIKKLGDKIIEIIRRCKEFIKKKFGELKDLKWRMSSDEKKIDAAIAKNPELADEIKIAISEGNIKISDIKDIKTFYEEVDNIMKEMKKDQIDPKSLKGRLERAKKKLIASEKPIKTVLAIAGSAAGLYLTYHQIKQARIKNDTYCEDVMKTGDAMLDKLKTQGIALKNIKADPNNLYASRISIEAQLAAEVERCNGHNVSAAMAMKANIIKSLDRVAQRIPGVRREANAGVKSVSDKLNRQTFDIAAKKREREAKAIYDELHKQRMMHSKIVQAYSRAEKLDTTEYRDANDGKGTKIKITPTMSTTTTTPHYRQDTEGLAALRQREQEALQNLENIRRKNAAGYRNLGIIK